MTERRTLSRLARVRIFDRDGGTCWLCHAKITVGQRWECDHIKPLWLGGTDDETNLAPVHVRCHSAKSAGDRTVKAKSDRVRAKHLGIKKKRGFRGWRKFNGEVVYADERAKGSVS